jgi:hypothetical protein
MLLTHNFNRLCADAAKHARDFFEAGDEGHPLPPRPS